MAQEKKTTTTTSEAILSGMQEWCDEDFKSCSELIVKIGQSLDHYLDQQLESASEGPFLPRFLLIALPIVPSVIVWRLTSVVKESLDFLHDSTHSSYLLQEDETGTLPIDVVEPIRVLEAKKINKNDKGVKENGIEIKKKHVLKSNRNKKTGNVEEDDVVVLEEYDEEVKQEDVEKDKEEDEEEGEQENVKEDEEEDKFVKYWLCEHTSIMNMQQSKDNCPRFIKWDMSDLPEVLARTLLESLNPKMVNDAELEPNNEKEKKLLHFLEQIENESDVMDDDTRECSLDHDGSKSEKDEGVEETNNDTNNLISDLLKEIDRLKEESKEKDRLIQTLPQKIAKLERNHVPYQDAAEQMFDYETEVETVHIEKGILQEEIVQKEVEIGGLYVNNDLLEEKLETCFVFFKIFKFFLQ
ncbi:hypothetical protein RHGRI_006852 [Rhododendron griersonianum]|uniref:Uncharacterized protein n=1 Tax=Rhododendron griersonianum TaxID=479676 RepID=A0AAV6KVE3_9ERIC|nr:hypothetical protein RHGRI_006852 [Rhododendron griersonianum]